MKENSIIKQLMEWLVKEIIKTNERDFSGSVTFHFSKGRYQKYEVRLHGK